MGLNSNSVLFKLVMARLPSLSSVRKPSGWRNESHRHYLAAKGISTKRSVRTNKEYFAPSTRFDKEFKIVTKEPRHSFFRRRPKQNISADFVLAPEDNVGPAQDKIVHNHGMSFEEEERKRKLKRDLLERNVLSFEHRASVARDNAEEFDKRLEDDDVDFDEYSSLQQASEDAWVEFEELSNEAALLRGDLVE